MKLLTVAETAEVLRVDIQRVYEMVRSGLLPRGVAIHLGRQVRINEDRLLEWLQGGGRPLAGGWRREPEV